MTLRYVEKTLLCTVPSLVVHVENSGGERGLGGSLGNRGVVQVTELGVPFSVGVPLVLAQHHV